MLLEKVTTTHDAVGPRVTETQLSKQKNTFTAAEILLGAPLLKLPLEVTPDHLPWPLLHFPNIPDDIKTEAIRAT